MNYNYRLTVHVENAEQTRMETGKVLQLPKNKTAKETKTKTFTTLSYYFRTWSILCTILS